MPENRKIKIFEKEILTVMVTPGFVGGNELLHDLLSEFNESNEN